MRFLRVNQLWLEPSSEESGSGKVNQFVRELTDISKIIDACPDMDEVYEQVKQDLVGKKRDDCGATGLSAEQALRAAIVKEKLGLTYRELEFHLSDSLALRAFVGLEPTKRVSKSILNRDIRLISEETWNLFNEQIKRYAATEKIEDGCKVRSDTTATETNIHHPTDASLMCDCIRVLTRLMNQANDVLGIVKIQFVDHNRRAAKRLYKINNAKKQELRRVQYRDLINITEWTRDYAKEALKVLQKYMPRDIMKAVLIASIAAEMKGYLDSTEKVIIQSIRRVLNEEAVPANEKIVSIFETHTDIIEKGARETIFGHKICVSSGRSGMILDCITLEGNPADSALVDEIISRHKTSYGTAPEQIAFDGGFASQDGAQIAKEHGVRDVVFSKNARSFDLFAFVSSKKVFRALSHFRAGIEAGISALKRAYGFTRVLAKGLRAFKTSLLNAVAAFNLTIIARRKLVRA